MFIENFLSTIFGAGWIGKVILVVVTAAVTWFSRRPIEKAAIMDMVNKRVENLLEHQEKWITHLTEAHKHCEDNLDRLGLEVEQVRGELRAEKQTIESLRRASLQ